MSALALPRRFWPLLLAIALLVAEALLLRARYAPPPPLDERAPAADFSARRAIATLARVLGDQTPHPTGSPANDRVRERLASELGALGLTVEDLGGATCGRWAFCATVHDLIAIAPGRDAAATGMPMLAAHYDSVAAGPGAADDGAGVATLLEIARTLRAAPPKHAVMLLFTDGEELGGLGARLFVERYRKLRDISIVINVEARGTTGPAILFETSEPNRSLIARYARSVSHPLSNSAAYTVYKMLPNDTDLTIFRKQGLAGYNFAFIGGPARYHTAIDDLAHLDAGSVQGSGNAALALLRAVDAEPPRPAYRNAVWFDVFGFSLIRWSDLGLSTVLIPLLLVLISVWAAARNRAFTPARVGLGLGLLPLLLAFSVIGGLLLMVATETAAPANWIARPEWLEQSCLFTTLTALTFSAALLANGTSAAASLNADALWWTLLSVLTVARAPGTSFLFLLPAVCAGAAALATTSTRLAPWASWLRVPLVALTGALWFPVLYFIYDSVGINLPAIETAALAFVLWPLAPLIPRFERKPFALAAACVGGTLLCVLLALRVAPFSADAPQRESLAYQLDADTGRARFLVDASGGPISDAVRRAGSLAANEIDPYPWFGGWGRKALAGPAPAIELPAPIATVLNDTTVDGARRILVHMSSPRNALALSFGLKALPSEISLDSIAVTPWRQGNAWVVTKCGDTVDGANVALTVPVGVTLDAIVFDHSIDLPAVSAPLRAARGALGTASQSGDDTVVSRAVRL